MHIRKRPRSPSQKAAGQEETPVRRGVSEDAPGSVRSAGLPSGFVFLGLFHEVGQVSPGSAFRIDGSVKPSDSERSSSNIWAMTSTPWLCSSASSSERATLAFTVTRLRGEGPRAHQEHADGLDRGVREQAAATCDVVALGDQRIDDVADADRTVEAGPSSTRRGSGRLRRHPRPCHGFRPRHGVPRFPFPGVHGWLRRPSCWRRWRAGPSSGEKEVTRA